MRRSPGRLALRAFGALVAVWLLAPTFVVIPMSFTDRASFDFPPSGWSTRWYSNFFSDPAWYEALLNSLTIAVLVTLLATALGTAAAFGLSRSRIAGKAFVRALLLAPMIVPVVIAAVATFAVFLSWRLVGTTQGFVLAHTALALPFVVVTVGASLRSFDRRLEQAAASLGATPLRTFFAVTLPSIRSGVLAGALFAFVTSFDELVVALFLRSPVMQTLPVQMYSSVTRDTDPTIAAASTLILAITTAGLIVALLARGKGTSDAA